MQCSDRPMGGGDGEDIPRTIGGATEIRVDVCMELQVYLARVAEIGKPNLKSTVHCSKQ